MNKDLIKHILTNDQIELSQLNEFIDEYVEATLNRKVTTEELQGIVQALNMHVFNLKYAATKAAHLEHMNILNIYDEKNNVMIRHIYE